LHLLFGCHPSPKAEDLLLPLLLQLQLHVFSVVIPQGPAFVFRGWFAEYRVPHPSHSHRKGWVFGHARTVLSTPTQSRNGGYSERSEEPPQFALAFVASLTRNETPNHC
jgi:hypothetical protein